MPVPGPRTQFGPDPGYRNPEATAPDFINRWLAPRPIFFAGETPGTKILTLRGMRLAPGQIRRMYKQTVNYIGATPPYSWTANAPQPGRGIVTPQPMQITRAWRYMTRSLYMGSGIDNSEGTSGAWGNHTYVTPKHINPTPTVGAGNTRNNPTVRNRLTSFGSRAPTLNARVAAAQGEAS